MRQKISLPRILFLNAFGCSSNPVVIFLCDCALESFCPCSLSQQFVKRAMSRSREHGFLYIPLHAFNFSETKAEVEILSPSHHNVHRRTPFYIVLATLCLLLCFSVGALLFSIPYTPVTPQTRCRNPTARQEWRSLSEHQKSQYLRAVQCLRTIPSRLRLGLNQTIYEDFPYVHTRAGEDGMPPLACLESYIANKR